MSHIKPRQGIFYGWWVVTACVIIGCYSSGASYFGFTTFINPLVSEFGWSYALISLAISLRGFEAGVLAPIIGFFVDKLGSKKLMVLGSIFTGLGMIMLGYTTELWNFYLAFFVISLGSTFISPVVTMTSVARWFKGRKASLPLGILVAGFAAGGLLVPCIIWIIDQFGWRNASIILGAGNFILCLPLAFLVHAPPQEYVQVEENPVPSKSKIAADGYTAIQAVKSKQFWLLSFAVLFGGLAANAVSIHLVPFLTNIGISRQIAGLVVTVFAIGSISGRIVFGWLGDLCDKRKAFIVAAMINAVGAVLFALSTEIWQIIPSTIMLAAGFGGLVPLRPGLQGELFGFKAFGAIQGLLLIFATVGGIVAPPWAGWIFDINQSYFLGFLTLAIASFIAVPMILSLKIANKDKIT